MKILVTGAAGFIGYHLVLSLLRDGYSVTGVDNLNNYYDTKLKKDRLKNLNSFDSFNFYKIDISNKEDLKKVFDTQKPDKVVNLAAQAGVRYSLKNPYAYLESNLVGFINVIELCRHQKVKGLVYASSSSIYGNLKKTPFSETLKSDVPISLYGATKKANELIAHSYSHLYNLKTTGLRFFTVYGPWYRPDMAMYIFIKKIINNQTIPVFNYGKMKRDFTYIDDIIMGTRSAIKNNYDCEIFNLGNNKAEKLTDMISVIESSLNKKANIEFLPMQPGDVTETFADINHSLKKLEYRPKTEISNGIPKLVNWFKEYYNV